MSCEGTLKLGKGKRSLSAQRKAGNNGMRQDRLPGDHGGHIIGSQFEGAGGLDNMVAMDGQVNGAGGKWYKMESEWANALKEDPPLKVEVKVKINYSGNSIRPDSFKVTYWIDGEKKVEIINNQAGG
ncbi:DNA/RNA non-specific endonuclease [Paenibacillus sp. Z6-24]